MNKQNLLSQAAIIMSAVILIFTSCTSNQKSVAKMNDPKKGTYGYDIEFLKKHTKPIELSSGDAKIVISPEYQGRVMTSTAKGDEGLSYGWINHDLIASGEVLKQINPVGGEERIWLGPEGGQYSIFFKNGSDFDFADWSTPACLDTEAFELVKKESSLVEFSKSMRLKNYSDFTFELDVKRKIALIDVEGIKKAFSIDFPEDVHSVAYESTNVLKNTGTADWKKETGLLSIWLLGMFNPSDEVTIFIPYKTDVESGYIVKSDYFGEIPSDRLVVQDGVVFFKGDGKQRGKLGILPQRALPVLGSYDPVNSVLTVVKCEVPEGLTDYVNSAWEMQEFPYKGDAINSYNDGPQEDGSQMGPFYELETSSPALALESGKSAGFGQITVHFEGDEKELDTICRQVFQLSIEEIKAAF